jgi:GNAT superfamily N-acetyltransferase
MAMTEIRIRPFVKEDQQAVRRICIATGYKGKSLQLSNYFNDHVLFNLLFCDHFLAHQQQYCVVAEKEEEVVGYLIGTPDNAKWELEFILRTMPRVIWRLIFVTWYRYPRTLLTVCFFLRHYPKRMLGDAELLQYPATLHMNVAPGMQGGGIGRMLMDAFVEKMVVAGAKGIHLRTTSANEAAINFYLKNGFRLIAERPGPIWPDNSLAKNLCFARELALTKSFSDDFS